MIKLYNTLSRQKEEFKPIKKGEAGIYTCGPTVYNYAHLGNLRAYIFEDILKRVLRYNGYKVKHVMNITDVGHLTGDRDMGEDKLEKGARREGKNAWEIAEFYTAAFKHDLELLNITEPDIWCKATDNIPEQIALIKKLEEKGYTYRTSDGIYFDTAKFKDYNKLSHLDLETLREGARVEKNDEKKNPTDFALWKFSEPHPDPDCPKITVIPAKACPTASFGRAGIQKKHLAKVKLCGDDEFLSSGIKSRRQMEWESPWGIGFPGWHIECSAMSLKFLKDQLDIHCGGIDHINVHHTNEIAQSEAATGRKFFNFWMHGAFLNIAGGKKMAKSEDNFLTLENALIKKGIGPLVYRFAVLETHYRKPMEYGEEIMKNAENGLRHLLNQVNDLGMEKGEINDEFKNKFKEAVSDDLNMPQALAIAQDLLKSDLPAQDKLATVLDFDEVLGLRLDKLIRESAEKELPENVKLLSEKREEARGRKDWAEADRLRTEIEKLGYTVEDTEKGMRIFKK